MNHKAINTAFLKLWKRAESTDRANLVDTFVDIGPLFTLLSSHDHQVLFGRRGTGKTHALLYLAETVRKREELSIYLDMRITGSTGGTYSDSTLPLAQRATRLLSDTLATVHNEIFEFVIDNDDDVDLSRLGPLLDELGEAITDIEVVGTYEHETEKDEASEQKQSSGIQAGIDTNGARLSVESKGEDRKTESQRTRVTRSGTRQYRVHFGRVGTTLQRLIETLPHKRIWLILDEWSVIPVEL